MLPLSGLAPQELARANPVDDEAASRHQSLVYMRMCALKAAVATAVMLALAMLVWLLQIFAIPQEPLSGLGCYECAASEEGGRGAGAPEKESAAGRGLHTRCAQREVPFVPTRV